MTVPLTGINVQSTIIESYYSCMFRYLRNCTLFQSNCICFYSHQWCRRDSPSLCIASIRCCHYFSHSDRYVVISCGFHLHFLSHWWCWISFHMLNCHLFVFGESVHGWHIFSVCLYILPVFYLGYLFLLLFTVEDWQFFICSRD